MLLDPFYAVYEPGVTIAKWLNRLLLLAEVSIGVKAVLLVRGTMDWWFYLVLAVLFFISTGIVNLIVRGLWNFVVVIFHGTTDPDVIIAHHRRRRGL